jgi:mannose-6-phosphate isomerase-like protein (cupin superfamily)
MPANRAAVIEALWEVYEFDPDSRPPDKVNGCGQIWEFEYPSKAAFSLAYCRMKGPSTPHWNTHVDELYIPARGSAYIRIGGREETPELAEGDLKAVFAGRRTPHAMAPITEVFECFLVTVPPYTRANKMTPVSANTAGWSELSWAMCLERAARQRGHTGIPSGLPDSRRITELVELLTIH